jgi:tartrate-resistant acid phosphatase type 5
MRKIFLILILAISLIVQCTSSFNFMSIGDWGCVPIGGWHKQDQLTVAQEFTRKARELNPQFILNTGDNFYYCGVHNLSDPYFNTTFEDVYNDSSLMVKWFGCLGNHDYGYPLSADSQILYTYFNSSRWMIPNRYYYTRYESNEVNISLVVLDSSPCQSPYTSSNPRGWDPCGSVIPGCPGCTFHQNVIKQNCTKQYEWFENITKTIPENDWKIVMTHAPAMDLDNAPFVSLIQKTKFHMYINGHVHNLGQYTIDNKGLYITTGAGCMDRIPHSNLRETACTHWNKNHTCQIIYQEPIAGFTTHQFINNFTELKTYFYSYDGKILHTALVHKNF